MKYIIIPLLKIIWSIILTIIFTLPILFVFLQYSIQALFLIIWEFDFSKINIFKWDFTWYITKDNTNWSVYDKSQRYTIYKTPYHYIWGIK